MTKYIFPEQTGKTGDICVKNPETGKWEWRSDKEVEELKKRIMGNFVLQYERPECRLLCEIIKDMNNRIISLEKYCGFHVTQEIN
jgi:hypothetical protein